MLTRWSLAGDLRHWKWMFVGSPGNPMSLKVHFNYRAVGSASNSFYDFSSLNWRNLIQSSFLRTKHCWPGNYINPIGQLIWLRKTCQHSKAEPSYRNLVHLIISCLDTARLQEFARPELLRSLWKLIGYTKKFARLFAWPTWPVTQNDP